MKNWKNLSATLLIAVSLHSASVYADNVGATLGWMHSTVKDDVDSNSGNGLQVGIFGTYTFIDIVFFRPSLEYSVKNFENKVRYSYLQLPLLVGASLPIGIGASIYANTGPVLEFLVSAKQNGNSIKDSQKSFVTSWAFGGGFDYGFLSTVGFILDLRYDLGLTTIVEPDDFGGIKNKMHSFVASVGAYWNF